MRQIGLIENSSPIATQLKTLIREKGVKNTELAKLLGVTRQSIGQYCDGTSIPPADKIIALADFFEVSTDYLLGRTKIASTNPEITAIHNYTGLSQKSIETLYIIHHALDERFIKTINFLLENESIENLCIVNGEKTINPDICKSNILFLIAEYFSTTIDDDVELLIKRNNVVLTDENTEWCDNWYRNGRFFLKDVVNTTLLQHIQKKLEQSKEYYSRSLDNFCESSKTKGK